MNLQYEGTCEFLRTCSRFSRNLPEGQVTWGCEGRGACDDDALWVAGPTRSQCGKTVRICRGSRCTNALVKDVSVSRSWEASNGVLSALGLPFGLTGRCSGYGGGQVTVEVQSGGSQAGEPSTPLVPEPAEPGQTSSSGGSATPPPNDTGNTSSGGTKGTSPGNGGPKDPVGGDGCTLATGEYVPDLGCVWATDATWYQCSRGQWYRGGDGKEGPFGGCSAVY